jgi:site-specific DNA recombinase
MKRRAAIYVRVSTQEQAESGYSIDEQVARLTKYCEARDWQLARSYIDPGFSGSNTDRPALQQLIHQCSEYDVVVVYKLDRLSRSQKDTLHLIEEVFNPAGVEFVSLSENFDTATAFGKAMVGILSVFAQLEREQIKERMALGRLGRAKSGKPTSWATAPFGYDYTNGELIIDPVQASVVRDIYHQYIAGGSLIKIANNLNARGHIGKKVSWSIATVRNALINPAYTGVVGYLGETFAGNHEAIIDKDTFDKAQAEYAHRQTTRPHATRPFQAKYLLSGMLRCGFCGSSLYLRQSPIRKDGKRRRRYSCVSAMKTPWGGYKTVDSCVAEPTSADYLEELVLGSVEQLRIEPAKVTKRQPPNYAEQLRVLSSELAKVNVKLDRLLDLYVTSMPRDILDPRREALEAERNALTERIGELENTGSELSIEDAQDILSTLGRPIYELTLAEQKTTLHSIISTISVGDSVAINWRFS